MSRICSARNGLKPPFIFIWFSDISNNAVILRGVEWWSRRTHHPKNNLRPPGEEGQYHTVDEGRGSALFHHPSSTLTRVPPSHREGFPSFFEALDSATQGKPFVQNDMMLRSGIGRRNYLLLVFKVEESSRQDKSSLLVRVWNNYISITTT